MTTVVTATELSTVSNLYQTVDSNTTPSKKWLTLDNNVLDGTHHAIPSSVLLNPNFSDASWTKSYLKDITYTYDGPLGPMQEVINFKDLDGVSPCYVYSYGDYAPQDDATWYRASVYVKISSGIMSIKAYTGDNSETGRKVLAYIPVNSANGWQKIVWDPFLTNNPNDSDSLSFEMVDISDPTNAVISMCKPELIRLAAYVIDSEDIDQVGWHGSNLSIIDYALSFDGVNNDWVSCPIDPPIPESNSLTAEAWVKSNDVTKNQTVISRNPPYFIRITNSRLRIGVYTDGVWSFLNGNIPLISGQWHHLALSYDGVSMKGYVDGVLDINQSKTGTFSSIDKVYMGYPPNIGEQYNMDGLIDDVRIWSTARTAEEIAANMYHVLSGNETGLVGYWKLNEGSGTTAIDATGNGNDGTIVGATWVDGSDQGTFTYNPVLNITYHSINRCPPFKSWVLSGGAYIDGDGNLVLPNYGSTAVSPFMVIDYATYWNFSAEYFSPIEKASTPGLSARLLDSTYYDASGVTTTNSAGYTSNGNASPTFPINAWTSRSSMHWEYYGGPNVKQMKIQISANSTYTSEHIVIRKPMLTAGATVPQDTPFEGYTGEVSATTHAVNALTVVGDALLDEYPVDFNVRLYNRSTVVYSEDVVGNSSYEWKHHFPTSIEASVLEITFLKVNKGGRTIKILQANELFEISRSDTVVVSLTDSSAVSAYLSKTDTISPYTVEGKSQQMLLARTDTLTPKTVDTKFFVQYAMRKADTIAMYLAEQKNVEVLLNSTDSLNTLINNSKAITANLVSQDNVTVGPGIEAQEFTAELSRPDTLYIALTESTNMTNVHTIMDGDVRRVYGKVEISYTDVFLDEDITITSSGEGLENSASQTADNLTVVSKNWFALADNKLDGTYYPISVNEETGWWSGEVSDINGQFSSDPWVEVAFIERSIFKLQVYGYSNTEYPIDFVITLYDGSSVLLHTETVTNNAARLWELTLSSPVLGVAKMRLTISKISIAGRPARILEFYTAVKQTYMDDDLMSIELLEEQVYKSNTLPIGNISSNEIDVRLMNIDGKFDPGNPDSAIAPMMRKNRKLRAWLGIEIIQDEIEWYPLGTFWTLDWNTSQSEMYVTVTARDRLQLLGSTDFTTSLVYQNYTLYQLAELILQDAGLGVDEYYLDTELQNITVPYAWFDRITHREALEIVAQAAIGRAYCNRDGQVVVDVFLAPDNSLYTFTDDDMIINAHKPLAWSRIKNSIEITASPRQAAALSAVYQGVADTITVPAGETVTEVFGFSKMPVINVQTPTFTGDVTVTIQSWTPYAWGVEITFINGDVVDHDISDIEIQGQVLEPVGTRVVIAKDDTSIRDNGKQVFSITDNYLIQSSSRAQAMASSLLAAYRDPTHDLIMETRGHVALKLGDRVTAPLYNNSNFADFFIVRQKISWDGSLSANVETQKIGGG